MTEQTTLVAARSTADVTTEHASRYLQQLCKHFAHKRPVTFDAQKGQISFSSGECHLTADGGVLTLSQTSPDDEHLAQLQDVVERHLVRFAFREELKLDWRRA
ncbi:MAG: DUF2218 domain-containing protein [Pseudolabrys sp.]|jgi:hypothetical protein